MPVGKDLADEFIGRLTVAWIICKTPGRDCQTKFRAKEFGFFEKGGV
jgi:hypothetical protein